MKCQIAVNLFGNCGRNFKYSENYKDLVAIAKRRPIFFIFSPKHPRNNIIITLANFLSCISTSVSFLWLTNRRSSTNISKWFKRKERTNTPSLNLEIIQRWDIRYHTEDIMSLTTFRDIKPGTSTNGVKLLKTLRFFCINVIYYNPLDVT